MEVSNSKTFGDSDNGGVRATHITKMSDFRYEQYAQKISGYITEWAYVTQTLNQMKKGLVPLPHCERKRVNGGRTLHV